MLIGSARLVVGEAEIPFTFPSQKAFQFELPEAIREVASRQCAADPVIPVWWSADQLAPVLERAVARYPYQVGRSQPPALP